jgi:hypothetical protein
VPVERAAVEQVGDRRPYLDLAGGNARMSTAAGETVRTSAPRSCRPCTIRPSASKVGAAGAACSVSGPSGSGSSVTPFRPLLDAGGCKARITVRPWSQGATLPRATVRLAIGPVSGVSTDRQAAKDNPSVARQTTRCSGSAGSPGAPSRFSAPSVSVTP